MWHFRNMGRGEMNQDPTQGDFFNTDHLKSFSDALIRESVQNSLDAKHPSSTEPVKVRITLPAKEDMPSLSDAGHYLLDLEPHISAAGFEMPKPIDSSRVPFLVFEDFGTRGLDGDPALADDPAEPSTQKQDFYYFWRNVGRGSKAGEDRGRWGLGKTVFPAASMANSFFGLTVRQSDGKRMLMGQSVLKIHHIDDKKLYPYGYFGQVEADGFVMPECTEEVIDDFCTSFGVTRTDEPGLSVVVPFPQQDIRYEDLVVSLLEHYFYPLLSGELTLEVTSGSNTVSIDSTTVRRVVSGYMPKDRLDLMGTLDLADWYLNNRESVIQVKQQEPHKSPRWTEDLFSAQTMVELADKLDSGEPMILRVPVHVIKKGGTPILSHFDMILKRDRELEHPLDVFIRSGITISGVHSLREAGLRVLVVADQKPLAAMLGDAENPAHTEWQDRSRNFKGKYLVGPSTLSFIKDAPRAFVRLLNKRSEHIDDTALRHLFPGQAGDTRTPPTPAPGDTRELDRAPRPVIDAKARPKIFSVSKRQDGFSVRLDDDGQKQIPLTVIVRAAYDVPKGNPYKRWCEADFILSTESGTLSVDGGRVVSVVGNRLEILAEKAAFTASASGFDPKRDLIVDVRRGDAVDA